MTLQDLEAMDREMLLPAEVASVLGCDQFNFTLQARADAGKLGFPVCIIGNRVRTPRRAFINWLKGGFSREEWQSVQKRFERAAE